MALDARYQPAKFQLDRLLAGGALLERGADRLPSPPSVEAMLRAAARGPRIDALLSDYAFLRRVEALRGDRERVGASRPVMFRIRPRPLPSPENGGKQQGD